MPAVLEIKNQYYLKKQKILSYNIKSLEIDEHKEKDARLILIRPCDAIALEYIDKVMLEEPADPQYKSMRENGIFAVVNCLESCEKGFCLSVGGSLLNNGLGDLELTEIKTDVYLVEPLTEKGEKYAEKHGLLVATNNDVKAAEERKKKALENPNQEIIKIPSPDDIRAIPIEEWEKIASGCLSCGFCNFSCPTCTCYAETHVKNENDNFSKIRLWDACILESFNLMAGGHTVNPNRSKRFQRRFSHKFEVIPEQYEKTLGCVGCGRCYILCPAHFDMKKIIQYLAKKGAESN